MAEVTFRAGLGRPLTYAEADDNFRFVEEQAVNSANSAAVSVESSDAAVAASQSAQTSRDVAQAASTSAAASSISAQSSKNASEDARDDALAAAAAIGPIKFFDTYADALAGIGTIPEGWQAQVLNDETREGARTQYKPVAGALEFTVNLDQLRTDLSGPNGSSEVNYNRGVPYSRNIRIKELLDSNLISPNMFEGTATQRMQRAIEFAESIGGATVSLPLGDVILGPMYSTSAGVYINGMGRASTKIKAANNEDCFNFNHSYGQGWGVKNLSIIYSGIQTAGVAINGGVPGSATVNGDIEGVYIERPFKALMLGNSQGTSVSKFDSRFFVETGIGSDGELNDIFLDSIFLNGAVGGTNTPGEQSIGLRFYDKAHAIMASRIEVIQCMSPMHLYRSTTPEGSASVPAFSTFHDIFFDSSRSPVLLRGTRNIKLSKAWFSNRSGGCRLEAAIDTTFESPSFVNNSEYGCYVDAASKHTKVIGGTFDSNGQDGAESKSGLVIADGSSNVSVCGTTFGNLGSFSASQDFGIDVGSGVSRLEISGNNFDGNNVLPVRFEDAEGANNADYVFVNRNIGYRSRNVGSTVIPSGQTEVIVSHGLPSKPRQDQISFNLLWDAGGNSVFLAADSITSTTFKIMCSSAYSFPIPFSWSAEVFND